MDVEKLFYVGGTLFAVAAVLYFTWEYLILLPRSIKTVMLFALTGLFFFTGEYLREHEV
jgi:hypothetical protein